MPRRAVFPPGFPVGQPDKEPAAHGEMRDVDVQDGDQGNPGAAGDPSGFPDGIIHGVPPFTVWVRDT